MENPFGLRTQVCGNSTKKHTGGRSQAPYSKEDLDYIISAPLQKRRCDFCATRIWQTRISRSDCWEESKSVLQLWHCRVLSYSKPTKATMSVEYLRQSKFPSLPDPSYPSFVVRQKSTNVLLVIAANGTSLVIDLRVQIRQDKERRDTSQDTTTSNKIVRYPRSIRIASNFDLHFIEVKRKCRRL